MCLRYLLCLFSYLTYVMCDKPLRCLPYLLKVRTFAAPFRVILVNYQCILLPTDHIQNHVICLPIT